MERQRDIKYDLQKTRLLPSKWGLSLQDLRYRFQSAGLKRFESPKNPPVIKRSRVYLIGKSIKRKHEELANFLNPKSWTEAARRDGKKVGLGILTKSGCVQESRGKPRIVKSLFVRYISRYITETLVFRRLPAGFLL